MRKDQIDRKRKHQDEEMKDDHDQLKKIEELNHKVASLEEKIDAYTRNEYELPLDKENLLNYIWRERLIVTVN